MEVTTERFEDTDELHLDGQRDWYYAGTIYTYSKEERVYKARRYDDTPTEANIFFQPKNLKEEIPYSDPLFLELIHHLVKEIGIAKVRLLTAAAENSYAEIDLPRALSSYALLQSPAQEKVGESPLQ
jgi:hypothetical protein